MKKVAIVCAKGIGDGLIYMVLSHNFLLSGYDVTTFSSALVEFKTWFPGHNIEPFPQRENYQKTFEPFDLVIAADHTGISENDTFGKALLVLRENHFNKKITFVDNLCALAKDRFELPYFAKHNGITPPQYLTFRRHQHRVIIHPTSTEDKRTWPADKFLILSKQLEKKGLQPAFSLSPKERTAWEYLIPKGIEIPHFPHLTDTASYIYESGYLIGNNSGSGHLASCLGIPTLSLFAKKSYSRLWRPGWGSGKVVTPPSWPIGGHLRQKYWKILLSPKRVSKAFHQLVKTTSLIERT